ncbi:MAG: CBS domain-containing protein [Armatimonadetes bacterium]|nr:CBS domain-containing protein [Armatimonadota bacterium]
MQCGELIRALEMMKTHVQRVSPDAQLTEAVDLMDLYQVSALPVVSETGTLMGILTERDIVEALLRVESAIKETSFTKWGKVSPTLVREAMSTPALFVEEGADVRSAALLMLERGLKRIPVVSSNMEIIGVLNRIDVLQALFEGRL